MAMPPGAYAIEQSCRAKARIVAADERETTICALLNPAMFAHALEAETGFGRTCYGEAVGRAWRWPSISARLGCAPPPTPNARPSRHGRPAGAFALDRRDNKRRWTPPG
jgi:3-dehydroquinate synthase